MTKFTFIAVIRLLLSISYEYNNLVKLASMLFSIFSNNRIKDCDQIYFHIEPVPYIVMRL